MEKTPLSMRKHIVMIGRTNAGKSTLFNALLGQDRAIVSDISGTTTDPVIKATELIPYGPVALADTAGFGDTSPLGKQREEKTKQLLRRADLVLWLCDIQEEAAPPAWVQAPVLTVYTKCELLSQEELAKREEKEPKAVYLSNHAAEGLDELKKRMVAELEKQGEEEDTLIGHLLPRGSCVVMVVPIDSAAPKGRLILPQVQLLRDCLDHDIKAYVTKETMLAEALEDIKKVDLVVTDSQVFGLVDRLVPKDIMLTSFSMLLAAQKGNFMQYIEGAEKLAQLKSGDRVLVLEGCSHNRTHEDIGRVKIPQCIEKKTGARCEYHYRSGYDFPSDLRDYALILSCGMCMIHSKEVRSRLKCAEDQDIPMVNYGVALAYVNGILDRAKEIFIKPKK